LVFVLGVGQGGKIIAVTKAIKNELIEDAVPERLIKVMYNFVDLSKFQKNPGNQAGLTRSGLDLSASDFVVGFAGRLVHQKGWNYFLAAAELIMEKIGDVRLVMVGDGPQKDEMLKMVSGSKFKERIMFLGRTMDMPGFYGLIDCLVIPSSAEGMPMVVTEAFAMGVPMVVSDIPAFKEVIRDQVTGLISALGDAGDIAEKILILHGDPELRRRMAVAGKEEATRLDVKNYSRELARLYDGLS
jgi:glycosyltransferase involved in cell wall biosynthesis